MSVRLGGCASRSGGGTQPARDWRVPMLTGGAAAVWLLLCKGR